MILSKSLLYEVLRTCHAVSCLGAAMLLNTMEFIVSFT